MKYLILVSLLVLVACKPTKTEDEVVNGFETACMQGVLYYVDRAGGYGKSLAPAIDAETMTYIRCEGKTK